jgi:hypothetical protein
VHQPDGNHLHVRRFRLSNQNWSPTQRPDTP